MAPVYHNERVREACSHCFGTGQKPRKLREVILDIPIRNNLIRVDFQKRKRVKT
jgi:hypothetical protein